MKINGTFSRSESTRSRRSTSSNQAQSFSTPLSSPLPPKSPIFNYQCTTEPPNAIQRGFSSQTYSSGNKSPVASQSSSKSPCYPRSPSQQSDRCSSQSGKRSPSHYGSPSQSERVFDFQPLQKSPNLTPKSPRSPRVAYVEDIASMHSGNSYHDSDYFNFNLQSPPKPKLSKVYHRAAYQASKADSNSSKSSLEYKSTTKHPNGDYQDIEYKVCNSLDSENPQSSDYESTSSYKFCSESRRSPKHSSLKEKPTKRKYPCNIRTNPGYDEKYSSTKSINESEIKEKLIQRYRKSTSDLTDMTDDAGNTTMTSLSRPSSPRRKGSVKGGLAYLASRRGSRDSVASNLSNISNEDIGPLNFQNTARGRQRRTSNFLELPGKSYSNFFNVTDFLYFV